MAIDRGVAPERTALAWHRTALAVACGAVVVTRLTYDRIGVVALAGLAVALPLAVVAWRVAGRRSVHGIGRGAQAPAAVAAATLASAVTCLAAVLS